MSKNIWLEHVLLSYTAAFSRLPVAEKIRDKPPRYELTVTDDSSIMDREPHFNTSVMLNYLNLLEWPVILNRSFFYSKYMVSKTDFT